jgi:hypothetical protein
VDLAQPNWIKTDKGTIEDPDNDLMWAVKDSRQELGKWLNWDEGMAYVKACNEQNYLGHNDWRLPSKSEVRSIFKNKDPYREMFLNLPKKTGAAGFQLSSWWRNLRVDF